VKQSDFKRRIKEIERADKRGLGSSSIELATLLVKDFPDRGRAWFEFGTAIYPVARYGEALSALRRALRLCPPKGRHVVQAHFGHLYTKKGEFRRAEAWFRKALAGDPRNATWHVFLGALLAVSGRLKEAEAVHRKATRCSDGCIDEAYLNLGLVLRAQQRYSEAHACFQKALKITPGYKEARRQLEDMEQVFILTRKRANPQSGANARQPSRSGTNRTSSTAASRRSP
jgi:tetratricopeptide (TPR) repeat protein